MFGHNTWDTKSFNAFSDEAVAKTDDPSIQAISQDIEIPIWTFTETTDSNGHPTEKFERTIESSYGSVTQHKEVVHPPPFGVTIHSIFTDADNETLETTLTKQNVRDPYTESEDETVRDYHIWELSGLDEWLVPETVEEEEEEETEEVDESSTTGDHQNQQNLNLCSVRLVQQDIFLVASDCWQEPICILSFATPKRMSKPPQFQVAQG